MAIEAEIDVSKYIENRLFGERPHIRGRRIPVATIAHSHQAMNWSVADLVFQFSLTEAEVLSALLFYAENRDDVEALEAAYQAELDEIAAQNGVLSQRDVLKL